ncbi:MAG: LrgB family protein [Nocardioides sp.]|nr:LrgB family protein [Nocardioides sp.]
MTDRWTETGEWLVSSPLFGVTLTLAAYVGGRLLWQRLGKPAALQPVVVAIVVVAGVLLLFDIDYDDYLIGGSLISFLLGPATVALAVPLYRQLSALRSAALAVPTAIVLGSAGAIVAAVGFVRLLGGDEVLERTMAPKSATTPVALELAALYGGIPPLAAVLTVLTGIVGAVLGPWVMTRARIVDPRARGLAVGTSSHGIGLSRILHDDPVEGAFGGLAMALTALSTSLLMPLLLPLLGLP